MDRAETPIRILREAPYAELAPNPNSTFRRKSQQKSVLAACWTKSSTRSATGGISLSALPLPVRTYISWQA